MTPEQAPKRNLADERLEDEQALRELEYLQYKYLFKNDWVRTVLCMPRFLQVKAFAEFQHRLHDALYWKLLSHITRHSHNHCTHLDLYRHLMKAPRARAYENFMQRRNLEWWRLLPDRVLLFRGHGPYNKDGIYYSTNPLTTIHYVPWNAPGNVINLWAAKSDCFYIGAGRSGNIRAGEHHQNQVLYIPGMGATQTVMNGSDEAAKEKLRQHWHDNPPKGFTAT